jgi:hypothetical protein
VLSPAEFLDHVTICSDCGTELVEESELALAEAALARGRRPGQGPYRDPAPRPLGKLSAKDRARRSKRVGAIWLFTGLLLSASTYTLAGPGQRYFVAVGPILYGLWRLIDGFSADAGAAGEGAALDRKPTDDDPDRSPPGG